MKMQITLIGLLFLGAVTFANAQSPEQFAAMEQRMATLELQNRSLLAAVEKLAGKPLRELLAGETISAPAALVATTAPQADPAAEANARIEAQIVNVQRAIAAAEADLAAWDKAQRPDPFAKPKAVKTSKVDLEKERALKATAVARLKEQEASLRSQLQ